MIGRTVAMALAAAACASAGAQAATPMAGAGGAHSVALRADGTVRAWGSDRAGELGIGTSIVVLTPREIAGLPPLRAGLDSLSAGAWHALAIAADGSVRAMGWNASGQLGDGTYGNSSAPAVTAELAATVSVAAGVNHSAAVTGEGSVWTWGDNYFGQLGVGSALANRSRPERVGGLSGFSTVAAGAQHTVALRGDGTVWTWGNNTRGQLGDGTAVARSSPTQVAGVTGIVQVAAGQHHVLALRSDGAVWAWGANELGQLCDGSRVDSLAPKLIPGLVAKRVRGTGTASYFVRNDDQLAICGVSAMGGNYTSPVLIDGLTQVVDAQGDGAIVAALRTDGTVWTFGFPGFLGRVGTDGSPAITSPAPIPDLSAVGAIAKGLNFGLAATSAGATFAWGIDEQGVLGSGRLLSRSTPKAVTGLDAVVQVSAGDGGTGQNHTLALRSDGTVRAWGNNNFGQLGNPAVQSGVPVVVAGLGEVTQIAAGALHSVALRADGSVWTWGSNTLGQLGRSGDAATPTQVPNVAGVVRVAARSFQTFAVLSDKTVLAWGNNTVGQLGFQTTEQCADYSSIPVSCARTPTLVSGATSVVDVAASAVHTLAVRTDGTVLAWGDNIFGELGDESTSPRAAPVAVPNLGGIARVAAGGDHGRGQGFSLALGTDGRVWSWGANRLGQLGNGTLVDRRSPAVIEGLDGFSAIAAGFAHSLAVRSDGTTWSWGENADAALGDGTYVNRPRPGVVLREDGAGTLDGNDWYLDIAPAVPNASIPLAAIPGMLARAQLAGSDSALVLDATASFKGVDFGRSVNLYVLAQVPPAFFDQVKLAPGAKSAAEVRAKTGGALVLAQLTPQGWTNATGQLIAYSQNVGNAAGAAASILNGINTSTIPGARFCIGYGETAGAMLDSIVLRDVLEVAGASGSASGVPCVLAGVYLGGPAASRLGTPVTFTASVVGLSPTGSVQFFDGAASMSGGVALTSANEAVAKASVVTSSLAAGIHGIAASYSGDAQNASVSAANSTPLRHEVSAPAGGTRVDLTGPVSSQLGETVAFTATVTGSNPTGTVQFKDGAANLGSAVPLVGAVAVLTVSNLAAGPHSITAVYSGDGNNAGNTSNALSHTVYASIATKVALTSSANPATQGTAITLTATVTGTNPTGSVAFRDGASVVATVTLASGVASTTLSGLGAGLHVMVADYLGDGTSAAASSPTLFQQVTAAGATIGPFVARLDAAVSTLVTSNAALVTGVGSGQPISVTGGEYSIGCTAAFTSAAGTVTEGQRVCVRHTSSASFATTTRTTLVVGTATADFTTTTMSAAFRAGITALVSHYYQSALRRPADPGGQAFWEAEGLRVHGLGTNIAEGFYAMAMAFFGSAEYAAFGRDNNGYATDLYATFFNRAPDSGGLAYWSGQLGSGLPREVLLAQFMFSPEFAGFMGNLFGNRPARAEVDMVVDFYRGLLARLPDSGGFDFWVRRFREAQCAGAGSVVAEVEAISSAFATSGEYAARARTSTQYVGDLYNAFLRRGGDLGGVQFWIGQLDSSARTREDTRRAFVASPEFTARVNSVVAQGCL